MEFVGDGLCRVYDTFYAIVDTAVSKKYVPCCVMDSELKEGCEY